MVEADETSEELIMLEYRSSPEREPVVANPRGGTSKYLRSLVQTEFSEPPVKARRVPPNRSDSLHDLKLCRNVRRGGRAVILQETRA